MAELKIKEEELTTGKLASYGIPPKQPDGPKLVKSQEPETLDRGVAVSEPSSPWCKFGFVNRKC